MLPNLLPNLLNDIVDCHVHTAPSLMPRRHTDGEILAIARQVGVGTVVLKAHEGSTVERARVQGDSAIGGIVLNSPVGGANPDAVSVAAALGGRIVWMPTVSAPAHVAARNSPELSVHRDVRFSEVPIVIEGRVRDEWHDVIDLVAKHDLVLASGHLNMDEAITVFELAVARGVQRLLVNHPQLPFLEWRDEHLSRFRQLGARVEIGVVADRLAKTNPSPTEYFLDHYPREFLVFGSDLGHETFPEYGSGIRDWIAKLAKKLDPSGLEAVLSKNGKELLGT